MSYGRYSDDPLEDSVFRDDELRMQEELDREIQEKGNNEKGSKVAPIIMICLVVAFFLWFSYDWK